MNTRYDHPFSIGTLQFPHRLIQGPLAGFSCAPFRQLFYSFSPPAYCVSEMISAYDVLNKHALSSRYLYRAPEEKTLCYQLAGSDPFIMAEAAQRIESIGADLIDINAGCPKTKIRKKGAGSALLEVPEHLCAIVRAIREGIDIPLTVKLRIQGDSRDMDLAKALEQSGADALIIHGRRWTDEYDVAPDFGHMAKIKHSVHIPVIANGDIADADTLNKALETGCDAFMIGRAGTGKPWLYQQLLDNAQTFQPPNLERRMSYFLRHLEGLARLEGEYQAILQSKSLVRYYFRQELSPSILQGYYSLTTLSEIEAYLSHRLA